MGSSDELTLGATIRAWRDRISPAAVGRAPARGRRAPGLRREDLADLAGVSVLGVAGTGIAMVLHNRLLADERALVHPPG